jgi:hypothetical protein
MGCVGECPSDGGCGVDRPGRQPVCSANRTTFAETLVAGVTTIKASHIVEMQNAVAAEKTHATRRGSSLACNTNCSDAPAYSRTPVIGNTCLADDWNDIVAEINDICYNANGATKGPSTVLPYPLVAAGQIILKNTVDAMRTAIRTAQYNCICDAYCNCNTDCGCDGECPSDGTPY